MSREESMDMDRANGVVKRRLVAKPVMGGSSGVGLPYAPEDWPLPGDKWRWKVSRRTTNTGYYHDRFLIPPARFPKPKVPGAKGINSKLLAERFVRKEIPGVSLKEFWGSFLWRVPSPSAKLDGGLEKKNTLSVCSGSSQVNGHIESTLPSFSGDCKVGNKMCHIRAQERKDLLPLMPCDICCTESGFCRDCSCILCGGIVDSCDGGYSFFRCKEIVVNENEKFICGHVAHMQCALRTYLAGTVGGNVALDAEYYCRRCDNRSDLITHFTEVLNSSKTVNCRDDIEKILNLGICLLRGSQKLKAKELRANIQKSLAKLRDGFKLEEVWNIESDVKAMPEGEVNLSNGAVLLGTENGTCYHEFFDTLSNHESSGCHNTSSDTHKPRSISLDSKSALLELENAIDNSLRELKESQEFEYKLAEEKLYAQKDHLLGLYQELEVVSESCNDDYLSKVTQIQRQEAKLKVMMLISSGFGRTPRDILRGMYGLQTDG